jgi:hypothetical protein
MAAVGVSRFRGQAHWERHMGNEELLYLLEGQADIVTMTEDGPVHAESVPGRSPSVRRQRPHDFSTPTETSEASFADDPRHA